ncbi:UDP-N-acetylmuramoyl-tripeptide--D-alanyl-D-alanine ligase [Bacillus sp. V3]|nr:UDP-N-acetylmuramoyl-tripeptide--D-alanyl-D-alanine ligase [Bacillus sp. V3]
MKILQLHEILSPIKGEVIKEGPPVNLKKVITQKKKLQKGTLLFCLDRNLGKTDIQKPFPPCVIITDRPLKLKNITGDATIVKVDNIKGAYHRFLLFHRKSFEVPIIAITGTSGKTTTKEMIKHILSERHNVKATLGNYNLFRSNASVLANFEEKTDFGVFEFGVGKTGNLDKCSKYFGPYSALITGIGSDHIERFGSPEKYRDEKLKILNGVGEDGIIILNADCPNTVEAVHKMNITPIWFGTGNNADYRAEDIHFSAQGMEFTLIFKDTGYPVLIPGLGVHTVYNALAALAAAHSHGIELQSAIRRLKTFRPLKRHLEVKKGIKGATLIDDTWNTNSSSVHAALSVLKEVSNDRHSIAVLGKISELGSEEKAEHKKIARMVIENQPSTLITIGKTASTIGKEAIRLGMNAENIHMCEKPEDAFSLIQKLAGPEAIILVKTSMRESFRGFLKKLKA